LPKVIELAKERERRVYGTTNEEEIAAAARAFIDFVALCEAKERETGEPCLIRASW
jgi:hypothetical protein